MSVKDAIIPDDCVLIAGAGPVGMLLANTLAHYGVRSVVFERNETTTKWPKMDLTNARSMELLKKIGLDEVVREKGVPSHIPYNVLFTTGLNDEKPYATWSNPSVDEYRKLIAFNNDGTQPQEPYQRISQSIFEAALKVRCNATDLIDLRFGWKVEGVEEFNDKVKTKVTEISSGQKWVFTSRYVAGCDGTSSKVRRSLSIPLDGGPTPMYVLLVHFKSTDLTRLHKQGRFWHIFATSDHGFGGAVIAQDEVDTWTVHFSLPEGVDADSVESEDAVATVFGGMSGKYPIKIDKILVRSTWRAHIAVARQYISSGGRILLAGDSAHQNIPTGGYGMNMGIGDAFDLGWKLAAVVKGYGKDGLLRSYEQERRPVALQTVEHSGVHMATHIQIPQLFPEYPAGLRGNGEAVEKFRQKVHEYYQSRDFENKDIGMEMGYRYQSGVLLPDKAEEPPIFDPRRYIPSTYPGMRAPHVFLNDGKAIFSKLGSVFTIVDFSATGDKGVSRLLQKAQKKSVPLDYLRLEGEAHAQKIWGATLAIIRPDFVVAWRGESVGSDEEAEKIVGTLVGEHVTVANDVASAMPTQFTSTEAMNTQTDEFGFKGIGEMQK